MLDTVQCELETLPELQEVVIGGLGEPFLHPQIWDFVAFLKQRNLVVTITSNGALIDDACADLLIAHQADRLVLSFETGDIGHANEAGILQTIRAIRDRKEGRQQGSPFISLFMVVTKENIYEYIVDRMTETFKLPSLAQMIQAKSTDRVQVSAPP